MTTFSTINVGLMSVLSMSLNRGGPLMRIIATSPKIATSEISVHVAYEDVAVAPSLSGGSAVC